MKTSLNRSSRVLRLHGVAALVSAAFLCGAKADTPDPIRVAVGALVAVVHAEGAQVYECKADAQGQAMWEFREPVATLMRDGKTIGRHYAGPSWEMLDGGAVTAKVVGRTPAASPSDIPSLKLEVISRRDVGQLAGVTKIQRINTKGGTLEGPCPHTGALASVPYAADYVFWREPQ